LLLQDKTIDIRKLTSLYRYYDTLVVDSILTKNGCLNFQQQRTISALDSSKNSLKSGWNSNRVYGVRSQIYA